MKTTTSVEICDHCSRKVDELWVDSESFHLCPVCWEMYHDHKPERECNYLTFENKVSSTEKSKYLTSSTHNTPSGILLHLSSRGKLPDMEALIDTINAVIEDPNKHNLKLGKRIVRRALINLKPEN